MKKIFLILSLILFLRDGRAQCSVEQKASITSSYDGLVTTIGGSTLYISNQACNVVATYDITNPSNPNFIKETQKHVCSEQCDWIKEMDGQPGDSYVAFHASCETQVNILTLTPTSFNEWAIATPTSDFSDVKTLYTGSETYVLFVHNGEHQVYTSQGLRTNPINNYFSPLPNDYDYGMAQGIVTYGKILGVYTYNDTLKIYQIDSNPSNPTYLGEIDLSYTLKEPKGLFYAEFNGKSILAVLLMRSSSPLEIPVYVDMVKKFTLTAEGGGSQLSGYQTSGKLLLGVGKGDGNGYTIWDITNAPSGGYALLYDEPNLDTMVFNFIDDHYFVAEHGTIIYTFQLNCTQGPEMAVNATSLANDTTTQGGTCSPATRVLYDCSDSSCDGEVNPGEYFDLSVTLQNMGNQATSGLQAEITQADSGIQIINGGPFPVAGGGTVDAGNTATVDGTFRLQALSSTQPGYYSLTLHVWDSQNNTWDLDITIPIVAVTAKLTKEITYANDTITVTYTNNSTINSSSMSVTAETYDQGSSLNPASFSVPSLAPGSNDINTTTYTSNGTCSRGYMTVILTGDENQTCGTDPHAYAFNINGSFLSTKPVLKSGSPLISYQFGTTYDVQVHITNLTNNTLSNATISLQTSLGYNQTLNNKTIAPGDNSFIFSSLFNGDETGSVTFTVVVSDTGSPSNCWAFTYTESDIANVLSDCTYTFTKPIANATYGVGDSLPIQWTKSGNCPSTVTLKLSDGFFFSMTIASNISNSGSYTWTIPDSIPSGSYRIVLNDPGGNSGLSPSFNITGGGASCTLTVTSPASGAQWEMGTQQTIRWSSSGSACGSSLTISLYKGSSQVKPIGSASTSSGSLSWTVPTDLTPGTDYRIYISDAQNHNDFSGNFSIVEAGAGNCTLTVVSPNGGEEWQAGNTYTIQWNASAECSSTVNLSLIDTFGTSIPIVNNENNDGSYDWTIPASIPDGNYKIKISDPYDNSDLSDAYFHIANAGGNCSYTFTKPKANDTWYMGSTYTIQWQKSGDSCGISVNLTLSNGETIATNLQNTTQYSWTIPQNLTEGNYHIILTDINGFTKNSPTFHIAKTSSTQRYSIAAAALATGAHDTFWVTDACFFNPNNDTLEVTFTFSSATRWEQVLTFLDPEEMRCYTNILESLFGIFIGSGEGEAGLIMAESSAPLVISSRTYNQVSADETYGQFVPGLSINEILNPGEVGHIIQITKNSHFRCNLGFSELDGKDTQVRVTLYDMDGNFLATKDYSVPAFKNKQINNIFQDMGLSGDYPFARATVEVLSGGKVYAYATVIDNNTGDPIFIPARLAQP